MQIIRESPYGLERFLLFIAHLRIRRNICSLILVLGGSSCGNDRILVFSR
jgi:hypothetical protein